MEALNVQFADASETTIVSLFSSPQDPTVYSNLGTVEPSDARWAAFYNSLPAWAHQGIPAPA